MGTTIQETADLKYTDSSGKYREGMKQDEAHDVRYWPAGIFTENQALEGYDKIDKDKDGILSHDEITAELKSDISWNRATAIIGMGLTASILRTSRTAAQNGRPKFARASLILAGLSILAQFYPLYKEYTLNKRLENGHN